jgi:alkaline phosphatase
MLEEMADAALKVLSKNRRGFVLMVEGAHIDKQSHNMDADRVIDETIEFDNAVGVARTWADKLGDTVVIVLADHECSGFSIIGALSGGISTLKSVPSDSATLDPLQQPARQKVVGVYDAAAFPRYQISADGYPATFDTDGKILIGFGADGDRYEDWQTKPTPVIDSLLPSGFKSELAAKAYGAEPVLRTPEKDRGFFIRGQATGRGQAVHTASDIPVSAYSTGSRVDQEFTGVQTNTDIFFKLMRAALREED